MGKNRTCPNCHRGITEQVTGGDEKFTCTNCKNLFYPVGGDGTSSAPRIWGMRVVSTTEREQLSVVRNSSDS
jgi:hypothetical protein